MAAQEKSKIVPSTLQIGEAAVIAERTRIPVVCDFRVADMAVGGNGAPLVPFADYHLFSRQGENVVTQNIGGIANCTFLPSNGKMGDIIAFDTGPGNMIIDALTSSLYPGETCDLDGQHARQGKVIETLLDEWMSLPYIAAPPPKTTGRELFGKHFVDNAIVSNPDASADDLIATATVFTARSIVDNLDRFVFSQGAIARIILAGGGAENDFLVELIRRELEAAFKDSPPELAKLESVGYSSKARECVAFALLGHAHLHGIPGNVPSATGASRAVVLGKLVKPV